MALPSALRDPMIVEFPALIVDDLAQGLPATDGPDIAAEDQRQQPAEQHGAGVQRPRPSRSAVWSLILVVALGAAWYLTEQWLPRHGSISPAVEIYILRPLIWAALGGLATIAWLRLPERPTFHWILPVAGLLAGLPKCQLLGIPVAQNMLMIIGDRLEHVGHLG